MATRDTSFKELTVKQKVEHIWEYYKPAIFGIVIAVCLIVYVIYKILNPDPDILMTAVLVNASAIDVAEENVFVRYMNENDINQEEETISIRTNLTIDSENASAAQMTISSRQVLSAMLSINEIDLLVANEETFDMMGMSGAMMSGEELLPTELVEKYADRFYTVKNEESGDTFVCGIWLGENNPLMEDGYYYESMIAGIPDNAANPELAKEMLLILLGEEPAETTE